MTRGEISAVIAKKAWHDDAFRKAVLTDANATYEQATGQKLPAGITIKVIEDDAHTVHFVIPARPAHDSAMSDTDLEAVAGGMGLAGGPLHPGTPVLPPEPTGPGPIVAPMSPGLPTPAKW
jgi:hypothetical protein